jgi:putative hemolysin
MADVMLKLALSIAATLTLVMVNGVFVAAEFAIVRVRRTRLEELAGEGKEAAKHAIALVDAVTEYNWTLRCLGHGEVPRTALTEEELELVLMDSHEEGVLTEGEGRIMIRAFEFADKDAEEILIAPEHVDFLSLSRAFEENLAVLRRHMHARLPLSRAGLDSVVEVVGMKDAWPLLLREKSNVAFERAARPPIKIPVDLPQDGILRLLQEGRGQMGVVRDREDQKTLGIVTLEDVLESLLGDVREAPRGGSPSC